MVEVPFVKVLPMPRMSDHALVCAKGTTAYLINLQGQVVKTFDGADAAKNDFVDCAVSPQVGRDAYAVSWPRGCWCWCCCLR
jgi:hypothetical protein